MISPMYLLLLISIFGVSNNNEQYIAICDAIKPNESELE